MTASFEEALERAWGWARARKWRGHDPYDALKSPALAALSRMLGPWFAIAATQAFRRSPVNPRGLFGIRPGLNPKALALFVSAAARSGRLEEAREIARLLRARRTGSPAPGWGYDFAWQARAFYLPIGTPTVVVTAFVGEAFVDLYESTREMEWLEPVEEAVRFVTRGVNRIDDETGICLTYSGLDHTVVYNASLLGARMLVRASRALGNPGLVDEARPLVTYALARQAPDGSWVYGAAHHHRWIDSFHTGFVLTALDVYQRASGDPDVARAVERGARFYEDRLFAADGAPWYRPGRPWPLDIHSAAQGVLTFLALKDRLPELGPRAVRAGEWMVRHLLAADGHFRYQIRRTHRVSIPYMRWSQAWGTRALAELVRARRGA